MLVDEHLGSEVARRAKADGLVLAMPIEKSGTNLFELEYGKDYPEHLAAFDPDFFKVLVRYNPADEAADRTAQMERLAEVSGWAAKTGWRWLFELLRSPHARPAREERGSVPLRSPSPTGIDRRNDIGVLQRWGAPDRMEA